MSYQLYWCKWGIMKPAELLSIEHFHLSEDGSQILLDIIPVTTPVTPETIYFILQSQNW